MGRILGTLAIVVAVAACGAGDDADASAQLACQHFNNTARDHTDGLLTAEELRSKLQEVERDARHSDEPGIPSAAKDMVATITAGDTAGFDSAVRRMSAACSDALG